MKVTETRLDTLIDNLNTLIVKMICSPARSVKPWCGPWRPSAP